METIVLVILGLIGVSALGAKKRNRSSRGIRGNVVSSEVEVLARVIRSESGSYTQSERIAIGWVVLNAARRRGKTMVQVYATPTTGHGGWIKNDDGSFWTDANREGVATTIKERRSRPSSSFAKPTKADLLLAHDILSSSPSDDPTGGSDNAFEPILQDKFARSGKYNPKDTAAAIDASWRRSSDYMGTVGHWRLYRSKNARR